MQSSTYLSPHPQIQPIMAWVSLPPALLVPIPSFHRVLAAEPLPHSSLVALLFEKLLFLLHNATLIPLSVLQRSPQCIEAHGLLAKLEIRHTTVDSAKLDRVHAANVFVSTENHHVLVYSVLISYSHSLYDIHDKNDPESTLQTGLPLAQSSKFSFGSFLRSATRSIILGGSGAVNLENVEHFANLVRDDEQRNFAIPSVKATRAKVLKMNAPLTDFWCKLNSQNVIFHNDLDELHVLNLKSFNSEVLPLADFDWFHGLVLLAYDVIRNSFFYLDSQLDLLLLRLAQDDDQKLTLTRSFLLRLDAPIEKIHFNPQRDVVLFQSESSLDLYTLTEVGKLVLLAHARTICPVSSGFVCKWAPDGSFFVAKAEQKWSIYSAFGSLLFDSAGLKHQATSSRAESTGASMEFLAVDAFAIASNSQALYLVSNSSIYIQPLTLLRTPASASVLLDDSHLSIPAPDHTLAKIPYPAEYQKIISQSQSINGTSSKLASKRNTGNLGIQMNAASQLSISYGNSIAVSTPAVSGNEIFHTLWYNLLNHFLEPFNIVNHFWVGDILVLVNRFFKIENAEELDLQDTMADELIFLDASKTQYGLGGTLVKFDTDLILWRHAFKKKVLTFEVLSSAQSSESLVTIITADLKNVVMEVTRTTQNKLGIMVRIRRTIHLSSMKHQLAIALVKSVRMIDERHFFFLLDNGDVFLLKNRAPVENEPRPLSRRRNLQLSNMYELVEVKKAVEWLHKAVIKSGKDKATIYITLLSQGNVYIYDAYDLVEGHKDPIVLEKMPFYPFRVQQTESAIEVIGLDHHGTIKNEHLLVKHKLSRQMILNRFIQHDLLQRKLDPAEVVAKYSYMRNFDYCLELLLFDFLDVIHDDSGLEKIIELVNKTSHADSIYVNFLRKIELKYWSKFFSLLNETPLGFMRKLIDSLDVELCYNYLIVYLNFKKESEEKAHEEILDENDRKIILQIIGLLKKLEKWEECFDLCRFLKLLEPSGEIVKSIRGALEN